MQVFRLYVTHSPAKLRAYNQLINVLALVPLVSSGLPPLNSTFKWSYFKGGLPRPSIVN